MIRFIAVTAFISLSGCSFAASQRCRELKSQGLVQGTLDSCTQCVGQLDGQNPDAINGCALGLDTARLVGGN